MSYLKAVILAGGFATRLRPLSCSRPKTLFPIVNKPLLQGIFEELASSDVEEVVLAVNALTQFHIKQQKLSKCGLKIRYVIDPPKTPLGTAGSIKNAEKLVGHDKSFIVLNGDILTSIDYKQLFNVHVNADALATIALCKVDNPCRYGVAELEEGNRIKRFIEKPAEGQAPTNLINAGVYVLSPKVFDYIPERGYCSIEHEIFPVLAKEHRLFGHMFNGLWMDIGKPEDYLLTNKFILDRLALANELKTFKKAKVEMPIAVDTHVVVGKRTVIGPYVTLGKNVVIGDNVQICNSIIFSDVKIGNNTIVDGAIIGEGAIVGENVHVNKRCIIADQAKIRDNVSLNEDLAVCPAKEVSETILKRNIIC
ncbi:MAG: NDP-sugar synthase [Candidatus Bathyarchaeota archaeon]|nr:NDP-sugar synthase [Candidatus Termiticorpusculum sp.]